jgi:hypothetical protein
LTEEQKRSITSELTQRLDGYHQAAIKKDTEWFRTFWLKSSDFAVALDGDYITDYDPWFEEYYAKALPTIKEILHFRFGEGRAAILNENAASYATTFDWGMVTTSNDTIRSKGSIVYVFVRNDGVWKCVQTGGTHKYY